MFLVGCKWVNIVVKKMVKDGVMFKVYVKFGVEIYVVVK